MKRVLVVLVGIGWAFLVFLLSFWITFPGDAVARRVEYQVGEVSRGNYALALGDVGPWWLGLSTDSVKLYGRDTPGAQADKLVLYATEAKVAAGLGSLLTRQPRVSGHVVLGDAGRLDYVVGTSLDEKGKEVRVTELALGSDAFPVAELALLIPGAQMDGRGTLQIEVDLDAPEGLAKGNGRVRISGRDLTLVNPVIAEFPLGRDVVFSEVDLEIEVVDGKGRIARGQMASDVATIALTGDLILADELGRSRLDARAQISLDPSMKMLEGMLASAAKDGQFHYRCSGPLNRMPTICTPDGDKRTAASRGRPGRSKFEAGKGEDPASGGGLPKVIADDPAPRPPGMLTEEDREKRRAELQERLRQRREQREAERSAMRPEDADPIEKGLGGEEDVKSEEDPPPPEEDLPLEEDLPIEEEEFVEE